MIVLFPEHGTDMLSRNVGKKSEDLLYTAAQASNHNELNQFSPGPPTPFLDIPLRYYPPIYASVFQIVYFHQVPSSKPCRHLSLPHKCHMYSPSHSAFKKVK